MTGKTASAGGAEVWAIPPLTGRAKASLVTIEYDEYGAGRADRIHAKLFADLHSGPTAARRADRSLRGHRGNLLAELPPPRRSDGAGRRRGPPLWATEHVIGGLLAGEPELEPDVVFGIDPTAWVEDRFGTALLTAWREGRSSLPDPAATHTYDRKAAPCPAGPRPRDTPQRDLL